MATTLIEALDDCLINFDSRILVTDLLQEYNLSYGEVHKTLEKYIKQQENSGMKYVKRFLVQGFEQEGDNEVYTVVKGETKLREWMKKLKNAESYLYTIEVFGGARAPAQLFKPVKKCAIMIESMKKRVSGNSNSNDNTQLTAVATVKSVSQPVASKSTDTKKVNPFALKTTANVNASAIKSEPVEAVETRKSKSTEVKKPVSQSSHKETKINSITAEVKPLTNQSSPKENKTVGKSAEIKPPANQSLPKETKTVGKKNVNKQQSVLNMFSAAANKKPTTKPATEAKPTAIKQEKQNSPDKKSAVALPKSTTKPIDDIKQEDSDIIKLSCTEGSLDKSSDSSDEEEAINALKREIIASDNETEEQPTTSKRRRVVDSDDDEDVPEQKHEKIDAIEIIDEEDSASAANKSETFLDDEDFVVTIKSKSKSIKKPSPRAKPAAKMPAKRKPAAASTKTKQANITNFFTKK